VAKRILFSVQTPLGYRVVLSRNRWREITRFKHPALVGHENDVRRCLKEPEAILASAKEADVHLYYSSQERGYICVIVGKRTDDRFVITAYFTKEIKKGMELWRK
jgi:hypothetical protein